MVSWRIQLPLAVATLGFASWLGYRAERRAMDAAGSPPVTLNSVIRHLRAPESRIAAKRRLNHLRHTAGRLFFSSRETAECWEIIRGFTVDDVKAYLAELPSSLDRPANDVLAGMLFFRWAQMDPEAAVPAFISQGEYAEASRRVTAIRYPAIRGPLIKRLDLLWTLQDPAAAAAWRDSLLQK